MIQTNTNLKRQSGFTIVELLIVIVVIGILAAITIVAFNGVQNRGKTASAQSLADTVKKKAEAYNALNSTYPADIEAFDTGTGATDETKLGGDASKVADGIVVTTNVTKDIPVGYEPCTSNLGARVTYFNYGASPAAVKETFVLGTC